MQVQTWEFQVWAWAEIWSFTKPITANGFVTKNSPEIILSSDQYTKPGLDPRVLHAPVSLDLCF